ncbi:hypothetical protein [Cellulomonas iranensis]|uniref:Uncharacterized protein n=2 Tax=Cellulomonas iranensis TaxID=76862 RepID=A0ABU0GGU3_9CELL|nr:hypothetical protein [Cellulomonas iranensis]MDQ0423966.1 hypothetical protein [Cellulomonas iranensis]
MHPLTVYDTALDEHHERLRRTALADARTRRTGLRGRTARSADGARRARRTVGAPARRTAPAATAPMAR